MGRGLWFGSHDQYLVFGIQYLTKKETGPAGPKGRATPWLTDMQSEMSFYFRLRAGYRLPAGKHAGILTHFQTKVNKKRPKMHFFWPF